MNRGDVVEVDWQFCDLSGSKKRPAVVIQADFLNGLIDDTLLVKIIGRRYGVPGTEVEIDPGLETASGLKKLCYASCKDLLTRDLTLILRTVGVLSATAMQEIETCLKAVFELS